MTTQTQNLITEVDGRRILHAFVAQDEPVGLMIMLPGRGYLNVYPVMHYLRTAAMQLGFDVLSITYGFQSQLYNIEEVGGDLLEEIRQAADQVLQDRSYDKIVVAAKSMGTPLASLYSSELAGRFPQATISQLMLTPIHGATNAVEQRQTLAVIGTADLAYDAALIETDKDKAWIEWLVLDDLDHALEHPTNWQVSIDSLSVITNACHEFLKRV
jgi:hypothetical protein